MDSEVIKLSQKNFYQICRICYQENDLKNIFQSKYQDVVLAIILEKIVNEKISEDDGLSTFACLKCLKFLLNVNAFLEQYKISKEALKSVYNYLYNKDNVDNISKKYLEIRFTKLADQNSLLKECNFISLVKDDHWTNAVPFINLLKTPIKVEEVDTLTIKNEVVHEIHDTDSEQIENDPLKNITQFQLSSLTEDSFKGTRKKPNRKDLKLHCADCNNYFKSHNGFRSHQRADHPNIPRPNQEFFCAICLRRYKVKNKLQKHLTVCHNRLTCVCDKCGRTVKRYSFVNHLKTHENDAPQSQQQNKNLCTICGAIVTYNLSIHMKKHHNGKKYRCNICSFETVHLFYLKKHELRHKEKQFSCKTCGKDFTVKEFFDQHLKLHEPLEKPMSCNVCSEEFFNQFSYDKHLTKAHSMRRISTLTNYLKRKEKCKLEDSKKSINETNEEKNYIGEQRHKIVGKLKACSFDQFAVDGKLKKFAKRCEKCGKICHNYTTYIEHMKFEHEIDKRVCTICNKQIQGFMTIHMKTHQAEPLNKKCVPCNKSFNCPANLKRHNLLIHENTREFKCSYCEKDFKLPKSLEDHIRTHTGETLNCDYCDKTFKQPSTRYKHLREAHNIRLGELKKRKSKENKSKHAPENMEIIRMKEEHVFANMN